MARPGLTQHRKFRRLARSFGSPITARGVLELLWDGCYEAGDDYVGTAEDIETLIGWTGEPGQVALALVAAGIPEGHGFLEPLQPTQEGDPIRYRVHDLWHHAPEYVTKRRKREEERRQRIDPVRLVSVVRRTESGQCSPSPDWQIEVPPPPARGEGEGAGEGSISALREGGAGGTFRMDKAFELLKSLYPPQRLTTGHRTERAFCDVLNAAREGPEPAFGRMLSNLQNHKNGHEWRVKGMIPSLENWLLKGAWEQQHEVAPPAADQVSPKTLRMLEGR